MPTVASFVLDHPVAAAAIGEGKNRLEDSITAAAIRLSQRAFGKRADNPEINALRHVTWQATIAGRFGATIARKVGYAHESELPDLSVRVFKDPDFSAATREKADRTTDLLNNVLGRKIGLDHKNATPKEMAELALDYFHEHGLYTVSESKAHGGFIVTQTKLSDSEYEAARERLKSLTKEGYTPEEQRRSGEDNKEGRRRHPGNKF